MERETSELEQIIDQYSPDATTKIYDAIEEIEGAGIQAQTCYRKVLETIVEDILKK